jgi:Glycerophosphoryl diester phosphodiesterase
VAAAAQADAGRGRDYLAPPLPRVIAHRGLALDAPENTIAAFRAAVEAGATHLETDVQLTADGVPVLAHDPDLTRMTGRDGRIADIPLADLAAYDLGDGARVPTLAEALAEFPHVPFNIDVKAAGAEDPTARVIAEASASERVLVTSFSGRRRRRTLAGVPHAATSASRGGVTLTVIGAALGIRGLVRLALRGVDAVQVPLRYGTLPIVTRRFVRAVHAAGVEVHVWTINEGPAMRALLRGGVDGIVTDRCDLAREVIDGKL